MSLENEVDYERSPEGESYDETDVSLRAHFARMSESQLRHTIQRGPMSS